MEPMLVPIDDNGMETGSYDRVAIYGVARAHYGETVSPNATPLFVIDDRTNGSHSYYITVVRQGGIEERYTFEFAPVGDYEMHYFVEGNTLFVKAIP